MVKSTLDIAKSFIKRRDFSSAILLLESRADFYEDDFEFYLTLGIACLYIGDIGNANRNFSKAREIKINNSQLLLGQAVIHLRRGKTDRAIQYYLDVLDIDPNNKIAKAALDFLKTDGDYSEICKYVDSGKILKFYPPLGLNPNIIRNSVLWGIFLGIVCSLLVVIVPKYKLQKTMEGPRENLQNLVLSSDERRKSYQEDLSGVLVHYVLDKKQITESYDNALIYFQSNRDNACQVEINRLLNSNASLTIKHNLNILMSKLQVPTFDSLKDNYSYAEVSSDAKLFLDCYVAWNGRISNVRTYENGSWECDFLIGYENYKNVEGFVPVRFENEPSPVIDSEKPVKFLAKISEEDGKIILLGKAVYQPLKGNLLF